MHLIYLGLWQITPNCIYEQREMANVYNLN
jgi:hypothetical protein